MKTLEAKNISLQFGGLVAVSDVSFSLNQGEILSVIGPNGAGKTSLFNVVTGIYQASKGKVFFEGREIQSDLCLSEIVISGLAVLTFAISAVVMINAQEFWEATIASRYIYGEPFDYVSSVLAGLSFLMDLDFSWNLYPFILAISFAVAALVKFRSASKFSPVVASNVGLARTFQNIRLLGSATVAENVRTVVRASKRPSLISTMLKLPSNFCFEARLNVEVHKVLQKLSLDGYSDERADSLPYGLQRRLEIARALATNPKVLLLDEPAAGLNPSESLQLLELVKDIRDSGVTVLLIEHDMSVVMAISDRIIVLHHGEKIAEGTPNEVQENPEVIKAYLGLAAAV